MNTAIKSRIEVPSYESLTNPAQTPGRAIAALACVAPCQEISRIEPTQTDPHMKPESSDPSEHESRHILGIISNYRTLPSLYNYEPLTSRGFNYSEWLGNSTAVAISNAYGDQRSASSSISKLAMQIGVDAVGNVLKEFWPDLRHKSSKESPNPLTREESDEISLTV